jgi:hypothetical protein
MTSSGTAHRTTDNGSILTTAEIKARIEAMFEGSAQLPRAEADGDRSSEQSGT